MVQLEFMTDSSVQEPQWRFKVKVEKNECTKSMKKFQVYSDHAMQCNHTLLQMRMKGLLTNKIKTICYLHFANIIYQWGTMQLYSYVCKIYTEYHYPMYDKCLL